MAEPSISRRKVAVGVLVTFATLTALGVVGYEWPAWREAGEARREMAAGRYAQAQAAAERWVRLRPRSAEAHFLQARAALALGRRNDLVEGMLKAKSLGYPEDEIAVLQALVDVQAGRYELARPVLVRAFNEAAEPDLQVDEALSTLLMELYDWPHAAAILRRWGEHAPNDPRPPLWLAAVDRRWDSDPEEIAKDFREALRRDPTLDEARRGLAEELARAGKYREASAEYEAYLAKHPDDPAGQIGAGRAALELGDLESANRRFDRALALDSDNVDAHVEKAKFSRLQGDEADALAHLDRAIALRPYDTGPRYNRRLVLLRLGRVEEARKAQEEIDLLKADLDRMNDLRERLSRSPGDANLQSKLALWMFAHGYDQEGLKWANKILTDHPGHPETCLLLARYYEQKGNEEMAGFYQSRMARPLPR